MRIDRTNPYAPKLAGLPQKAKPAAKKTPADERAMEGRIKGREKMKQAAEQMKSELQQMKQAEESMKAQQQAMKTLMTCMEISRRIISGDKVPQKDHDYLMEHDMVLYAKSIMMRRYKEDPYEHDQLSEDEESGDAQGAMSAEVSGGSESAAPAPKLDVSI